MARLPRYPLTVFDNISARGHQSLARDQLEYCNLNAADGQKRVYDLTREQRAMDKSALCQDYAAGPSSGWEPAAPGRPHRGSLSCIELN